VEEAAAVSAVPGTAIPSAVAGAAVAVGESTSRSKSRSRSRARSRSWLESSAALWVSGEATAFLLPIIAFQELHLCDSEIAFVFFRGGVAVTDSPVAVAGAVAAASVERITAVAGAAVVSLYAAPLEGAAVAEAAAIALAAAAPVVGAAVAVAAAVPMAAAAPAEGAAVGKAAVEGPDPEALFLSLSQASLFSLLYCCLLALGGHFFVFLSAAFVSLHQKVTSSTPPLDSS
jgi:hypothetical protein